MSVHRKDSEIQAKALTRKGRSESDELDRYIEEIVAQAPPMSVTARAKLTVLLGGNGVRRAA